MPLEVTEEKISDETFEYHVANPALFQGEFISRVLADPNLKGKVLDIGCGDHINPSIKAIYTMPSELHGVDTVESISSHPDLEKFWCDTVEAADIPGEYYDLALAYNVVEHIEQKHQFLYSVYKSLKTGGSFWALTPNSQHPFSKISFFLQQIGLKNLIANHDAGVNDYPAYYRLNCNSDVVRVARKIGFQQLNIFHMPCTGWDRYFPPMLRFLPHAFDRTWGVHHDRSMLVFMFQLIK
tara:strand:- start:6200 stop:6916 length:717 start_codon:yes stop_codon:yes gene_type:complete